VARRCRASTIVAQEAEVSAPQPLSTTTTTSSSDPKRKHGRRRRNQIPERGQLVIEKLGDKGEPVQPEGIAARFWNIVGSVVRDQLASWITTSNWKNVPKATKDALWAKVKEKFAFPEGMENIASTFAEGLCGRAHRNLRSVLNTEFVQKGKDVRALYGNIPLEVWEEFVEQKKTIEAVALSV
jgi:hypothetical protein